MGIGYWLGGALGAFNIAIAIFLAPKIGAVLLGVSIVAGQMIAALIYDQNGILGFPEIKISFNRILGVILVLFGVILIAK